MDIITGYDITIRIINRIIAEQNEYVTITRPMSPEIKNGMLIYGYNKKERVPLHKELFVSLERWRDYMK